MQDKDSYNEYIKNIVNKSITTFLKEGNKIEIPKDLPEGFTLKKGVFVTLKVRKSNRLRGCIGIPLPELPLIEALIDASISAAVRDPRFPKVTLNELKNLIFDVSVLTPPELIKVNDPSEYLEKIITGKHGLIVEKGFNKGLLLPQVAPEHHLNTQQFLEHTCMKAGLSKNEWKQKNIKIYSFHLDGDIIEGEFK